jgi:glycosyltransferase involved in cell wall biosynthesis
MRVTGCIILGNGYRRTLRIALNSLKPFCHKIMLYDGSNDGSYDSVKDSVNVRIAETPPLDYGRFRNICLDALDTEWMFFHDADEYLHSVITPQEFWARLVEKKAGAFWINRFNYPFGANYPEPQARIIRKGSGHFERAVHERFMPHNVVVFKSFLLIHLPRSKESLIARDARYLKVDQRTQNIHAARGGVIQRTREEYEFSLSEEL